MAKQVSKGGLAAKFGKQFNAAKNNEVSFGSTGDLPEGIEMGIAQLVECKFDKFKDGDNVGEDYFYAAGIVKAPAEHAGMRIVGLRTSIMEAIMDTPTRSGRKTIQDHVNWVINEFKKLGVSTEDIDFSEEGMIEAVAQTLKDNKPHFRFRTWKGKPTAEYPNPRTNHEWKGAVEYSDPDAADAVEDETPEAEPAKPAAKVAAKPAAKPGAKKPAPAPEPEPEDASDEVDLDALIEAADGGDEEAIEKMIALAGEAGIENDTIEGAENWAEIAGLIRIGDKGEDEAEPEAEAEEEWKPAKGDVYKFKPIDPKTKKPGKAVEGEVIAVQEEAETVHLKNNDTKKVYADLKTKKPIAVKWAALDAAE